MPHIMYKHFTDCLYQNVHKTKGKEWETSKARKKVCQRADSITTNTKYSKYHFHIIKLSSPQEVFLEPIFQVRLQILLLLSLVGDIRRDH